MIERELYNVIRQSLFKGKAIILIGARQVGKSTLMKEIISKVNLKVQALDCDRPEDRALLADISSSDLRRLVADNKIIYIDEAQMVPEIGLTMKRIVDEYPNVQLLVTGSSSLDLTNKLNEPLTGRKQELNLFPVSTKEIFNAQGLLAVKGNLEQRLVYGSYPYIYEHPAEAESDIMELSNSYLYKDLLKVNDVRRPVLLDKLLKALAFQVGSLVSYNEIAQLIGSDSKTVEKYIDLLEKCYVVFRINGLSRNLRNELKKAKKVYFYDNGVRNAVIQNFASLGMRNDVGALWENFIIGERIKYNSYSQRNCFKYFWRNDRQQEIDYVEEKNGQFEAFEFKWNPLKSNVKMPESFSKAYNIDSLHVITPDNYLDWLDI